MQYQARIEQTGDKEWEVTFPDKPNINTFGESLEHAKYMAKEALKATLEVEKEEGFEVVPPKEHSGSSLYWISTEN